MNSDPGKRIRSGLSSYERLYISIGNESLDGS